MSRSLLNTISGIEVIDATDLATLKILRGNSEESLTIAKGGRDERFGETEESVPEEVTEIDSFTTTTMTVEERLYDVFLLGPGGSGKEIIISSVNGGGGGSIALYENIYLKGDLNIEVSTTRTQISYEYGTLQGAKGNDASGSISGTKSISQDTYEGPRETSTRFSQASGGSENLDSAVNGDEINWRNNTYRAGGGGESFNFNASTERNPGLNGGGTSSTEGLKPGTRGVDGTGGGGGVSFNIIKGFIRYRGGRGRIILVRKPFIKTSVLVKNDLVVDGNISKSSGSFKIDHPLPHMRDSHFLVHSFIESPFADLIYSGMAKLGEGGVVVVNIDEAANMTRGTFTSLVCNTRYSCTNESGFTPVKSSINGNELTIVAQDTECRDIVYWQVTGERCDKHMKITNWTDQDGRVIVEPKKTISK